MKPDFSTLFVCLFVLLLEAHPTFHGAEKIIPIHTKLVKHAITTLDISLLIIMP